MSPSETDELEARLMRINDHRREGGLDKGAQLLEHAIEARFSCSQKLAVYGSLAPGKENHHVVSHLSGRWVKAHVHGELLDRGWGSGLGYPAMRWHPDGEPIEVDLLESLDLPEAWDEIDEFEGSGYARILVPIYKDSEVIGVANIYELAREVEAEVDSSPTATILETPRLVLRQINTNDLEYLAGVMSDPEVMKFFPQPLSVEETEAWIERQIDRYAKDCCGYWLALEKSSKRPIGQIGVLMSEIDGRIEPALGYIIDRCFWRRRFASEGAAACLEWVLKQPDFSRVLCVVRPENQPSQGVARRIGMVETGRTMFAGYEHRVFSYPPPKKES